MNLAILRQTFVFMCHLPDTRDLLSYRVPFRCPMSAWGQTATWRLVCGKSGHPPIPDITLSRRTVRRSCARRCPPAFAELLCVSSQSVRGDGERRASDTGLISPHSAPKTYVCVTSVRPSTTDSCRTSRQVGSGPKVDSCTAAINAKLRRGSAYRQLAKLIPV
jgi:hypothetical protein